MDLEDRITASPGKAGEALGLAAHVLDRRLTVAAFRPTPTTSSPPPPPDVVLLR